MTHETTTNAIVSAKSVAHETNAIPESVKNLTEYAAQFRNAKDAYLANLDLAMADMSMAQLVAEYLGAHDYDVKKVCFRYIERKACDKHHFTVHKFTETIDGVKAFYNKDTKAWETKGVIGYTARVNVSDDIVIKCNGYSFIATESDDNHITLSPVENSKLDDKYESDSACLLKDIRMDSSAKVKAFLLNKKGFKDMPFIELKAIATPYGKSNFIDHSTKQTPKKKEEKKASKN